MSTVICSIDKDLLQVPGLHYNWVHDRSERNDTNGKVSVSEDVGLRKLYQQVLTGDSTDAILGIRGVGPVTARKIIGGVLAEEKLLFDACVVEWRKYLDKEIDGFTKCEGGYTYEHWDGSGPLVRTAEEIVDETLTLVEVGGKDARAAMEVSGEEVKWLV